MSYNHLRQVIRGILAEMPFKGVMPVASKRPRDPNDDYEDDISAYDDKVTPDALKKFHSSKKFLKSAKHVFEDFPQDIYILPIAADFPYMGRVGVYDREEAIKELEYLMSEDEDNEWEEPPIEGINLDEISDKLSQGATIIASFTNSLTKGFLSSPWMIIHAILDNSGQSNSDIIADMAKSVADILYKNDIYVGHPLLKCLTMKSARDRDIGSEDDAAAEIITQEIATRRGFYWRMTPAIEKEIVDLGKSPEECKSILLQIEDLLKSSGMKQNFISALQSVSGKLVIVDTYAQNF